MREVAEFGTDTEAVAAQLVTSRTSRLAFEKLTPRVPITTGDFGDALRAFIHCAGSGKGHEDAPRRQRTRARVTAGEIGNVEGLNRWLHSKSEELPVVLLRISDSKMRFLFANHFHFRALSCQIQFRVTLEDDRDGFRHWRVVELGNGLRRGSEHLPEV